jgi:hypothetical protein
MDISIALKIPEKGEQTARACDIACLRQLSFECNGIQPKLGFPERSP